MPASPGQNERASLGQRAETLVADLLRRRGYQIVARNLRVGRLELDIVARLGRLLVVCEVRGRTGERFDPAATIDRRKVARVRRATAIWLSNNALGTRGIRFDAAAVTFHPDRGPTISYYQDAF